MNVENYLQTRNLCVGYDGVPLIRDIALSVRRGEIVALIGPNGAGKSTILKSITRQLKRISGVIEIGGAELRSLSARKLATWPAAWTPASVRPLPWTSMGQPNIAESACSSLPWMVFAVLPCFCQPL